MSDVAIRVENLSKRYRIGGPQARYKTLRDTVMDAAAAPIQRLRRLGQPTPPEETIWALKDVSFEVKHGEALGIIGRNGSGKTTLLKVLSRITEPTEGYAQIHGRVGSLLEVGTGFHPELTGRENVYLNGAILGMKRAEIDVKFDEIVDFAEIEKFLDTPVKRYSSGMYVRLAFSVAAHLEPEILLVDEVLAVGDAAFQKKCLGKMGDVAHEGRTVLFVSHNTNAVCQLCQRVILIESGGIMSDGGAVEVTSTYLGMHEDRFEGATLDTWRTERGHRPFFSEIRVNDVYLPGELVVSADQAVHFRMVGDPGDERLSHFRCGVHVATQDGMRIMSYGTPWSDLGDIHVEQRVVLTCAIPKLPLIPGKYSMSIGCSDDRGPVDWLENVAILTVVPGDEAPRRPVPTYKTHGYYLTDSTWKVQKI